MSKEEWRPVVGYEGLYEVSSLGRVKRVAAGPGTWVGRILKANPHGGGYLCLKLHNQGRSQQCRVHVLVAEAFLERPSPDHEVNHKNGDKGDNRVENLEWVTRSENTRHAMDVLGTRIPPRQPGEANGQAKLTREQVREIRRLYATGKYTHRELAARFGIAHSTVTYVILGQTWKHVS